MQNITSMIFTNDYQHFVILSGGFTSHRPHLSEFYHCDRFCCDILSLFNSFTFYRRPSLSPNVQVLSNSGNWLDGVVVYALGHLSLFRRLVKRLKVFG